MVFYGKIQSSCAGELLLRSHTVCFGCCYTSSFPRCVPVHGVFHSQRLKTIACSLRVRPTILHFGCCDVFINNGFVSFQASRQTSMVLPESGCVNSLWRFKTQQTSQINQLTPLFPSCLEVVSVLTGIGSLSYLPKNGLNMQLLHLISLTRAFLVFSLETIKRLF